MQSSVGRGACLGKSWYKLASGLLNDSTATLMELGTLISAESSATWACACPCPTWRTYVIRRSQASTLQVEVRGGRRVRRSPQKVNGEFGFHAKQDISDRRHGEPRSGMDRIGAVLRQARERDLLSDEHFTVDGTLEAWASLKK
jgi:hypothetical protein